jgi:hypothetical protein
VRSPFWKTRKEIELWLTRKGDGHFSDAPKVYKKPGDDLAEEKGKSIAKETWSDNSRGSSEISK